MLGGGGNPSPVIKLLVLFLKKKTVLCIWYYLLVCLFFNISVGTLPISLIILISKNPIRDQGKRFASFFEYLCANADEPRGNWYTEVLRKA